MSSFERRRRGLVLAVAALSLRAFVSGCADLRAADPCAVVRLPHLGAGRVDQIIRRCQQLLARASDPEPYLERLGWAFVARARQSGGADFYRLAEQCALCIETRRPQSPPALLLRAHVLTYEHRFHEAELLARRLVTARGEWFDHGVLGDALVEQGKVEDAVAAYEHMMALRPGPQAYARAAHVRWIKGDLEGAIWLMGRAAHAMGAGDSEASAWAFTHLALYELSDGQLDGASTSATTALSLEPDYAPALLARGRILLARSEYDEAAALLARAVELSPLPESRWALLEALEAAGRREEGERVRVDLLRTGSMEDPRTLALYLATTRRHVARALQLARRELEVRRDVLTLDVMAWALRAGGSLEEARLFSEQALREGTRDARLFYHAGVIALESGDRARAGHLLAQADVLVDTLFPSERDHLREDLASLATTRSGSGTTADHEAN